MDDVCLVWAPVIGIVVSAAKKIPIVKRHPKIVATLLAIAVTAWRARHGGPTPDYAALLECVAVQISGAVLTFEAGIKPIARRVAL